MLVLTRFVRLEVLLKSAVTLLNLTEELCGALVI